MYLFVSRENKCIKCVDFYVKCSKSPTGFLNSQIYLGCYPLTLIKNREVQKAVGEGGGRPQSDVFVTDNE